VRPWAIAHTHTRALIQNEMEIDMYHNGNTYCVLKQVNRHLYTTIL